MNAGAEGAPSAANGPLSPRRPDSLTAGLLLWRPGDGPVGLYVHVPFCRSFCSYCAFARERYVPGHADRWLDALARELGMRAETTWSGRPRVDTVFVGGGTPSALTPDQWMRLASLLREHFDLDEGAEVTSEANPESFTAETAEVMRKAGVNRLSLGVQSFDPEELRMLGRPHGARDVVRAVKTARDAGFNNVNLDLIYGLPGGTRRKLGASLDAALELEPEHLSAYCLSLEPGTILAREVARGTLPRPDDDESRRQYELVGERAERAGLALYEISNFARPGRRCRHNLRYWTRRDFIGVGPSAHSLLAGRHWSNPAAVDAWMQAVSHPESAPRPEPVPPREARFEWVFLRLRLAEGFAEEKFVAAWGTPVDEVYGAVLERLVKEGMLLRSAGRVRLSPAARFVSDSVFAEFAPEP